MQQRDPEFREVHTPNAVAPLFGLTAYDFAENLPIQTVSTGLPFVIVPLRSLQVLRRIQVNWSLATPFLDQVAKPGFFYLVTEETENRTAKLHARAPDPAGDDPATVSAAGCAAAWMVMDRGAASGERFLIEQGSEVHPPSRIYVSARRSGSAIVDVRVAGNCVRVMQGQYRI